jgi:hypothetical protein
LWAGYALNTLQTSFALRSLQTLWALWALLALWALWAGRTVLSSHSSDDCFFTIVRNINIDEPHLCSLR